MLASMVLAGTLLTALPEGEWLHILPPPQAGQVLGLLSDSQGTVYVLPSGRSRHAGRWDYIPFLKGGVGQALVLNSRDYWVASRDYGPDLITVQIPDGVITHYREGTAAVYDTANSCLEGNLFRLLGMDGSGKVLVDQRYFSGWGGPSKGVIRFDGMTCEPIHLGLRGDEGAVAYVRDSAGREYFSIREISDVPSCRELVRLDRGRLDTFAEEICINKLVARGGELLAATSSGIWIFSKGVTRKILEIQGRKFSEVYDILFDSRGVLWIGTEGYDFFPENIGLVAISGKDTVIHNKDNSGFPSYFASGLAEDAHGNIWVGTWAKAWPYSPATRLPWPRSAPRPRTLAGSVVSIPHPAPCTTCWEGCTVWSSSFKPPQPDFPRVAGRRECRHAPASTSRPHC